MNPYLASVVLGAVEGLTEFLPISSTGHLILVNHWIAFEENFTKLFDVFIQSGAILAVVILFWKDVWPHPFSHAGWRTWWQTWRLVLLAFIPTAILGALFASTAETDLFHPLVVAGALAVYGVAFLLVEKFYPKHTANEQKMVTGNMAILIGLIQALALVPGTSRSGVTILALLLFGYSRTQATRFSFLLAIPTLFAASGYSMLKHPETISWTHAGYLGLGFFAAFLTAYVSSAWFLSFIAKHDFKAFGIYRLILAALVLLFL